MRFISVRLRCLILAAGLGTMAASAHAGLERLGNQTPMTSAASVFGIRTIELRPQQPFRYHWYLTPTLNADWNVEPDSTVEAPGDTQLGAMSRLRDAMASYTSSTFVPYVWGGSKIGAPSECMACRSCIAGKKRLSVERRLKACEPCRKCGIDCSHFVNRVYADAGLNFPYATTRDLARSSRQRLRERYELIDIGRDVGKALPGDLLLHSKHVVMLLGLRDSGRGDILHVSRSIDAGGVGGIEVVPDQDLGKFRGKVLKILRHVRTMKNIPAEPVSKPKHERKKRLRRGRGVAQELLAPWAHT